MKTKTTLAFLLAFALTFAASPAGAQTPVVEFEPMSWAQADGRNDSCSLEHDIINLTDATITVTVPAPLQLLGWNGALFPIDELVIGPGESGRVRLYDADKLKSATLNETTPVVFLIDGAPVANPLSVARRCGDPIVTTTTAPPTTTTTPPTTTTAPAPTTTAPTVPATTTVPPTTTTAAPKPTTTTTQIPAVVLDLTGAKRPIPVVWDGPADELPYTGGSIWLLVGAAALLIAGGTGVWLASRDIKEMQAWVDEGRHMDDLGDVELDEIVTRIMESGDVRHPRENG